MTKNNKQIKQNVNIAIGISDVPKPGFAVHDAPFIKFIALHQWYEEHVLPQQGHWEQLETLLQNYKSWIENTDKGWPAEVVDGNIGFSRKLGQLLSAQGIAHSSSRQNGKRGIEGVKLRENRLID